MTDVVDPVLAAHSAATRELRALDALLAASDGAGPPVCAAFVRAWFEVASLAWALQNDETLGYHDFIDGVQRGDAMGGPVGALVASDRAARAIVDAATFPPPPAAELPPRRAVLRYRRALLRWSARLGAQVRSRRRFGRRHLIASSAAIVATIVAVSLLHRTPVWRVLYFRTTHLTDPVSSDLTANIGGSWGADSPHRDVPADGFSARWETCLVLDRPHTFEFVLGADDGARLAIDDAPVIDNWADQSYTEKTRTVSLEAGAHTVRVEHFDSGGNAELSLMARIDGKGRLRPLPASLLRAPGLGTRPCAR